MTDTAALRQLDVIVASQAHEPPIPALESIEAAVKGGTGLFVRRCLGSCSPGVPVVANLLGLATAEPLGATDEPVECVVVGEHPILGRLSGQTSFTFMHRPAGAWGTLPPGVGVSLIRIKTKERLHSMPGRRGDPTKINGDLVYVSARGKGRVVHCNFWAETPPEIQKATDDRFTILSVKWLAGRPVK